jgi:hypothetical protein
LFDNLQETKSKAVAFDDEETNSYNKLAAYQP